MPFGEMLMEQSNNEYNNPFKYNGKELDEATELYYYGARYYDPRTSIWLSVDPLAEKFSGWSPYNYAFQNPVKFVDPDGREPIPSQAGVILGFIKFLNNTRSKMGTLTGSQGHNAMMRLGRTEMNWAHLRPEPMTTNPFNISKDKYIYTTKGGWLDMAHFMFYAGKAYDYKQQKESAQKAISEMSKAGGYAGMGISADLIKTANMNPVGEAVQDGYRQEMSDRFVAGHSAYSYEDLPSDKLGAEFGANYYNPNSKLSLGEQLLNYVNSLGATDPKNAPNYKNLPKDDSKGTWLLFSDRLKLEY
ncbi:RHS repeat domain-containing protein [Chryseobacterium koreense]|uniref:RHS repeat domain-containing protein n=1 Tax=Chryseobacterium koreense TaxID=232216 RepID=UPI0026EDAC05|nr:RHS repeat-associated core domain-containing protein [Chryseobacterium koreense]